MIHLTSEISLNGIKAIFLKEAEIFEMQFSRIVIGLSFEEGCHAVFVGERAMWFDSRSLRERRDGVKGQKQVSKYYVVLDEAHHLNHDPVFQRLIEMKDKYEVSTVHGPDRPIQLAESLKNLEGLSFYHETRPHVAADRWKSFKRFELRSGLYPRPSPDESTMHRELEALSTTSVLDPETGRPLMGLDQLEITAINMPSDFPNKTTFAALRNGRIGPCQALWYACTGLETSRPPDPDRQVTPKELRALEGKNDNPTGY